MENASAKPMENNKGSMPPSFWRWRRLQLLDAQIALLRAISLEREGKKKEARIENSKADMYLRRVFLP